MLLRLRVRRWVAVVVLVCAPTLLLAGIAYANPVEPFGVATVAQDETSPGESVLQPGQTMEPGDVLTSANGRYQLNFQINGDLVLRDVEMTLDLWRSGTIGDSPRELWMLESGALVMVDTAGESLGALWSSRTHDWPTAFAEVRDDGTLVIAHPDGRVFWTVGQSTPATDHQGVKHMVYSLSQQRVWMFEADGTLFDNYLVSGHQDANMPTAGEWAVWSKSPTASSYTAGISMNHMVRFAKGPGGGNIGFHSLPRYHDGTLLQTVDQLGQKLSAGCVRQRDDKALQLYRWAPIGTPVTVLG